MISSQRRLKLLITHKEALLKGSDRVVEFYIIAVSIVPGLDALSNREALLAQFLFFIVCVYHTLTQAVYLCVIDLVYFFDCDFFFELLYYAY